VLQALAHHRVPTWLVVSSHGMRLLQEECGIGDLPALRKATEGDSGWATVTVFADDDRGAKPASGSQRTRGMVICPCSMGTVAAVAHGTSRSLIERAADVTLKEGRKLVLVPRETPLSLVHLRNLTAAAEAGATIVPAAPGFYHRPQAIGELVDFLAQRILDQLGLEISIAPRWQDREGDT
jgi:4-hydroxy-3-polyprenylbenzoate decarboxylase